MVCKEEVVNWFRGQCGALRIDTMCALLDCCLPYELRFVGTILENLGRRDFHELRDVENRLSNAFATHKNPEENKKTLFNLLSDTGGSPASMPNSNTGPHISAHPNHTVPSNSHDTSTSRPSPTHTTDQKFWPHWNSDGPQHQSQSSSSANLPLSQKTKTLSSSSGAGGNNCHMNGSSLGANCVSNCNSCTVDESDKIDIVPTMAHIDLGALSDERKRHKLTLYFSLLRVSNRVCSSAFYALLTHVDQTVNNDNWLEGRDENTLEELALLYTMGNNHPAFTFEQRTIVGDTLTRIRAQLQRFKIPKNYQPHQAYLASGFDPKYCHYYVQYVPHTTSHIQHQVQVPVPQPPVGGVVGNLSSGPPPLSSVDISRIPQQLGYTFPQYSQYPVFVQTHSQPHTPIIQNQVVGKNLGATLNSKPPSLQQSISLDSGWTPKKVGKEKGLSIELDQQSSQTNDPTMSMGRSRKTSCYNCGSQTHFGQDCKESTIEEITKYFYRLNYSNSSAESS